MKLTSDLELRLQKNLSPSQLSIKISLTNTADSWLKPEPPFSATLVIE